MRLDLYLVEKKFTPSKSQALNLIKEGLVKVDGQIMTKGGKMINPNSLVEVAEKTQYVSRGAKKLLTALDEINLSVKGFICGDFGASTGGFSQVLLERGAKQVFAIDVGKDQLHERLRKHPKLVNLEEQNVRDLESLPEKLDFACADLSFISLRLVIEKIISLCNKKAKVVVLFKPQFEVGKENLNKLGVVKEGKALESLEEFKNWLNDKNIKVEMVIPSQIKGQNGNQEYLVIIEA